MGIGCRFFCGRNLTCSRFSRQLNRDQSKPRVTRLRWFYASKDTLHDQTIKNEPDALQKLLECWHIRDWRENCRCMQPPAKDDEVG